MISKVGFYTPFNLSRLSAYFAVKLPKIILIKNTLKVLNVELKGLLYSDKRSSIFIILKEDKIASLSILIQKIQFTTIQITLLLKRDITSEINNLVKSK